MHYYQLLYKIKSSPFLWIVSRKGHYVELLQDIDRIWELENYKSNIDEYYIIKQNNCHEEERENIEYIKQFTTFKLDKNSELLFRSQ